MSETKEMEGRGRNMSEAKYICGRVKYGGRPPMNSDTVSSEVAPPDKTQS